MNTPFLITGLLTLLILLLYSVHMLIFTFGWFRLAAKKRPGNGFPGVSVSIIVAMRDELHHVERLIRDLVSQDYPQALLEVILVDDHSTDGTAALVRELLKAGDRSNFRFISMEEEGLPGSKKAAIEAAVDRAMGELILVTDADCSHRGLWVHTMVDGFEGTGRSMIAGPVRLTDGRGLSGAFQEMEFASLVASGAGAIGARMPIFCNGANMAFRKTAFKEVRGYSGNEQFSSGDDVFLLHKFKQEYGASSIGFVHDREAIVSTAAAGGWKAFLKQRIRWASKAKGYTDVFSLTTALSVFLVNMTLVLLLVLGCFDLLYLGVFASLFLVKMLVDFPIMVGITSFLGRKRMMFWFVPFEFIYIFYTLFAGSVSFFYGGSWKGREVKF